MIDCAICPLKSAFLVLWLSRILVPGIFPGLGFVTVYKRISSFLPELFMAYKEHVCILYEHV